MLIIITAVRGVSHRAAGGPFGLFISVIIILNKCACGLKNNERIGCNISVSVKYIMYVNVKK